MFYIYILLFTSDIINTQVSNVIFSTNSSNQIYAYNNQAVTKSFIPPQNTFNCAQPDQYIYNQTYNYSTKPIQSIPYFMKITTNISVNISFSTQYQNLNITASPLSCTTTCNVTIYNNCPKNIYKDNYYDLVYVRISTLPLIQYKVNCDQNYLPTIFQWGLFILITLSTIIIFFTSFYSRAWSLGGNGYQIKLWLILAFDAILIIGAIIGALLPVALNIILQIISWILGPLCIALCCNQIIWLFKLQVLNKKYFNIIRVMDIISLAIGIALTCAWFFTDKNWILNDIVSVSIIIAFIKCLKFTSLKMSVLAVGLVLSLQIIGGILIHFLLKQSYNILILNQFNNPLLIQFPTISKSIDQKCAWLPVNQIIFPGLVISYLRRFDDSRNTRIYLIISCIAFYIGSMLWMLMSVFNIHSWPFSIFSEPSLLLIVVIFAYQRNEIKTVWTGQFYDEQFRDKYEVDKMKQNMRISKNSIQLNPTIFRDLKIDESSRRSSIRTEQI